VHPHHRISHSNFHFDAWTDIYPTDIISQWQDEWKSALVVNSSLVDDSTIRQPGFDLPQCHWTLLNRFQTEQGHCTSCWGLAATVMCPCDKCRIMSHIVNRCPQTKLEGELQRLHSADDDAIEWLETYLAESYRNRNNVALCGMYGLWKTLQFLRVKVSKCTPKQQQQQLLYQSSQSAMPSTIQSLYYSKVSNADRIW